MRRLSAHHQRREERREANTDPASLPEHLRKRHERRGANTDPASFFGGPEWTGSEFRHNGAEDGFYIGRVVLQVAYAGKQIYILPLLNTERGAYGIVLDEFDSEVELLLDNRGGVQGLNFLGIDEVHSVSSMSVLSRDDLMGQMSDSTVGELSGVA